MADSKLWRESPDTSRRGKRSKHGATDQLCPVHACESVCFGRSLTFVQCVIAYYYCQYWTEEVFLVRNVITSSAAVTVLACCVCVPKLYSNNQKSSLILASLTMSELSLSCIYIHVQVYTSCTVNEVNWPQLCY